MQLWNLVHNLNGHGIAILVTGYNSQTIYVLNVQQPPKQNRIARFLTWPHPTQKPVQNTSQKNIIW